MSRTDGRVLGKLARVLAAIVLSGFFAACGEASAASPVRPDSSKFAGAFVNWGPDGRENMLQTWEKWLRQPRSSVVGVDFYGQETWDDFYKFNWVPGIWKKLNPARIVVWSMPLSVKGTPLADVADGLHDAEFEAAARAISEAQPRAIIRLGWEMNLGRLVMGLQRPGGGIHQGFPARGRHLQALLKRLQIRLVSGMGSARQPRRSRLSRRRRRRLHRARCLRLQT